jgi:YVTN family beta-propeller protein
MKVKTCKLLSLLFIMIFALSAVNLVHAVSTLPISSTIKGLLTSSTAYGGYGTGTMAYDSGKSEIYVTAFDFGNVSALSDSTNKVVANVTLPTTTPHDLAYDSGMGEIFVASGEPLAEGETPTLTIINDSTNAMVANITSRNWWTPWGVAYDSGKGEIFMTDYGHQPNVFGGVYLVNDSTNAVGGFIYVGNFPEELVYDSGMGEIFVDNYGSSSVSVINDSTNAVVATVNLGSYPTGLAYDSGKGEIFVAVGSNTVSVISDSTNAVVANVTGLSGVEGIAYDSGKGEIFAGNAVISDSNNTVVAQVPEALGMAVYDSGKGEMIGAGSTALDVFSDSSSVPEFSSAALILVLFLTVSVVVVLASKKSIRSHSPSILTTK